ncbi:hypothetical protein PRNP1_002547 [Phytophthora ramorum]
MANRSEDEWSLVSDGEEILSDTSYDEVEPEHEAQVETELEVAVSKQETLTASADKVEAPPSVDETADVLAVLADTSVSERSTTGYSREIRISLLSPAHQDWFVDAAPPRYTLPTPTVVSRQTNIKLAFTERDVHPRSFPERLRAITAAMRPLSEEEEPPTFTEVTSFKQDQSTQADLDSNTASEAHDVRALLLRSALDRSMKLANQLRSKSQDNERLSLRIADLESVAVQTEQKFYCSTMKIKLTERSLALAKQQTKLTAEYQDNLKTITDDLRRENARLVTQNAALRGEGEALGVCSVDELEELESALARGMDQVRASLRAKYRAAMEKRREKELCVVCFAKPISVVLLPCRHQVLCASCAVRVTTCPIDRKDIQDKVLTYGLDAYTDNES